MSKLFKLENVTVHGALPNCGSLSIEYPKDLIYAPLWWQARGLSQTASGYGGNLTGSYKINFEGKKYRIYHTCYGNASCAWFITKGKKIFVN